MEWDTAAAHSIVSAMGGKVLNMIKMVPLIYNKQDLNNPDFLVKIF
jgi:3'(2'), 5'-bisphosphate nucleotidase